MSHLITSLQNIDMDRNGVACFTQDIISALARQGKPLIAITPYTSEGNFYRNSRRWQKALGKASMYPWFSLLFLINISLKWITVYRQVKRTQPDHKQIIANDIITGHAAMIASGSKKTIILVCHFWTYPWQEFVTGGFVRENSLGYRIIKRYMMTVIKKQNLKYVFFSRYTQDLFKSIIPDSILRGTVIYAGVDGNHYNFTKENLLKPGSYIINVGTLDARKNQEILVDIACELRKEGIEIPFVLVGHENKSTKEKMMTRITENGLAHLFHFIGPQDRRTTYQLISNAYLYLHTSSEESFGRTLIEAMSLSTPVLAIENGTTYEILGGCEAAIINRSQDLASVANQLRLYIEDKKIRQKLISCQSIIYKQKFTLNMMADQYLNLLIISA